MMSSGVIGDRQLNSPYNASSSLMSILILDLMDKVNSELPNLHSVFCYFNDLISLCG